MPKAAIFPWGDVVEDFLDPLGLGVGDFLEQMSGGWLFGYVLALKEAGWRSTIIVGSRSVARPRRVLHGPTGVPIWLVPARSTALPYSSRRSLAQWWRTPWRHFARALREEKPDVVLVQEYEYARFDALALLAKRLRLPLYATFQGGDQTLSALEGRVRPWALRQAQGLIVASDQERRRLVEHYARVPEIHGIPNPIDDAEWRADPREAARAALGLPADAFIVVNHGRIDIHRKGLDVLVAAWARFARDRPRARLVLIGSGQDDATFATLLAKAGDDRIDWRAGYTTDRVELRRWLSAADVYLTTSRVEGMPVAPLEAMALGLPIVASRAQGLPDILDREQASGGLLVPCDDPEATASALSRLCDEPLLRQSLGRAARARIETAFSLQAVGRQLADVLGRHVTC